VFFIAAAALATGCGQSTKAQTRPGSFSIFGDTANVERTVMGGAALVGGGGSAAGAYRWLIDRGGGGDVVVITASSSDGYAKDIFNEGGANSVETLDITSKEIANNDTVAAIIRNAEMLFIAGGDQSNYMNFWRGTKTLDAINYLLNVKRAPVGGTSAGCAVLGQIYYSGETGSAVSDTTLNNPYDSNVTLYKNDLLQTPYLKNLITDQHYVTRNRSGRHVAFMARIITDWGIFPKGIAPDEKTAVCIDEKGMARVFGAGNAYFIRSDASKKPERCVKDQPLQWYDAGKALKVYELHGSSTGNGTFNVANFEEAFAKGGNWYWWSVQNGQLEKKEIR
jgi:cyanophycinase